MVSASAGLSKKTEPYRLRNWRILFVYLVLLLCLGGLVGRLLYIQVLHPEFLIKEGNNRVVRSYSVLPARGIISDRNGKVLALSVPVKDVSADPLVMDQKKVTYNEKLIRKMADILCMTPAELYARITTPGRRYVRLTSELPMDKGEELEALKVPGLTIADSYKRYYPTGEVNAVLLGMVNKDGRGVYGIEQSFNTYLSAAASSRTAHKDQQGHIIENLAVTQEGKPGGNLVLSVDDRLQTIAYSALRKQVEEFAAESGCAALIDVRTGEVLAMVTVPSFDPNDRREFDSDKARNRTVTDVLEPGSTFKPLVALSALEHNVVSWKEVFDTRPFIVDGKVIKDSHTMDTGTLADILKYSSNTGMAQIAMRLGPAPIMDMFRRFGLGQSTGSGLVGEVSGQLNASRPFWAQIDKATLGYGYGIMVTPLQLASVYATLANLGYKVPVSMLKLSKAPAGVQTGNVAELRNLQAVLETVVSGGGTGTKASISRYRIAGKTGTAKIAGKGGYSNAYVATFAGFAPLSAPRFAMVVTIRHPTQKSIYGGTVSGPVFREVMTQALQLYNVAPDAPEPPEKP